MKCVQHDVHLIKQKLFGYESGKLEEALSQHNLNIPFTNMDQWRQFETLIEDNDIINNSFVSIYKTDMCFIIFIMLNSF